MRVGLDLPYASPGDHAAAFLFPASAEFDHIVGMAQHLRVVVHEHHRVAVVHEVVHHAQQTLEVRGVHADRRFVEHVEYAGGLVAHRAGELHPLALAGRKGGGGAVETQIAET